jgi:spermidine/putrescine transport system permease protein
VRRRPFVLASLTWLYVIWSIVPVLIAVQFSFNDGRSRTSWQGASFRWYWGDPFASVWHDESLRLALINSLRLGLLTLLIATPIGTALALGLTRWRGRGSRPSNALMLLPAGHTRDRDGQRPVPGVHQPLHRRAPRPYGAAARARHVLDLVRGGDRARAVALGRRRVRDAARDLGASPIQAIRTVLIPLLMPSCSPPR